MKLVDAIAIRRLHILSDCILVGAGWICAYWLRYLLNDVLGKPINSFQWYLNALPVIVLPWVFSCWLFGIYRSNRMKTVVDELQLLFRGVALGLLVVSSLSFFFRELQLGRLVDLRGRAAHLEHADDLHADVLAEALARRVLLIKRSMSHHCRRFPVRSVLKRYVLYLDPLIHRGTYLLSPFPKHIIDPPNR